jgi:hypothetical protein
MAECLLRYAGVPWPHFHAVQLINLRGFFGFGCIALFGFYHYFGTETRH